MVGVGRVVTSKSLGGVMVCTLAQNVTDVGSIPALDILFPILITLLPRQWCRDQLCAVWLLNLSSVCIYESVS